MIKETVTQLNDRWRHRRRMAWITFIFDHALVAYLILYGAAIPDYMVTIITTFLMTSGTIIGTYIGFSTWDDINNKKEEIGFAKRQIEIAPASAFEPQAQPISER